jgi:predicted AlkP superfamily pyrophosphatase or phosphodiesterase
MFLRPSRVAHRERAFGLALLICLGAGQFARGGQQEALDQARQLTHVDHGPNSAWAQHQHYVVLVSLDGFRWDYARRDHAAELLALGAQGASAPTGMLPSYPSVTFPNHLTIVTGLYPEHHGIVANSFYDPVRKGRYADSDRKAVSDGSWYSGVPLWSLAESHGMRTACLAWPGAEAEIAGYRPTWYAPFDAGTGAGSKAGQARLEEAVVLLRLPAATRPHFIAIYYPEPDHVGHQFGPDAPETRAAVLNIDALIGKLRRALAATGLPVDLVVVSDHGMAKSEGGWVTLDQLADLTGFEAVGSLLYADNEEDRERLYDQLKHASSLFMVYRLRHVPAELEDNQNPRAGDPVIVATGPYAIRAHAPGAFKPDSPPRAGVHGFDPGKVPQMKAGFFAAGPDIVKGKTVAPFENVHLYPWLAHMLGMKAPQSDGSLNILSGTLRDGGEDPQP